MNCGLGNAKLPGELRVGHVPPLFSKELTKLPVQRLGHNPQFERIPVPDVEYLVLSDIPDMEDSTARRRVVHCLKVT